MKIYCFYLIRPEIDPTKYPGVLADTIRDSGKGYQYSLYAFTPEKWVRDYFISTRKMKIFYEKEIEIDRMDYDDFCDDHNSYLIEYHGFKTQELNKDGYYQEKMVELLCTTIEADNIYYFYTDVFSDTVMKFLSTELSDVWMREILNKELHDTLRDDLYIDEMICAIYPIENTCERYDIDEMALYVLLFKNTLSKKGRIK